MSDTQPEPATYAHRCCPACGSDRRDQQSVHSDPPAEDLPFARVLEQWDTDIFNVKSYFSYFRCGECGLLYCPEYPDDRQLEQLYGSMSPNMAELPEASFRRTQQGYLDAVLRHRPPSGDMIEVGPDRGFLAAAAAKRPECENFWFIEPNVTVHGDLRMSVAPKPCDISTDLNHFGHIQEGVASMVFMVHVLDHLTDPMRHLVEVRRCLKPGGLLSIVVHNERSLLARVFGHRHPIYCPYHPQLFNPVTLAAILERAGFEVLQIVRTRNHYPAGYLLKNALCRMGLGVLPIPATATAIVPLPLGNIQAIVRKKKGHPHSSSTRDSV
jgi:SAM-dependent methyltransferase